MEVDACGLMCPGPIVQLKKSYADLPAGVSLRVRATDPAFGSDVEAWCRLAGAELVGVDRSAGVVTATVRRPEAAAVAVQPAAGAETGAGERKTLIVFSDDLDRALATFVIANGAAAAGKPVTLFFTFWGLNVIKKRSRPAVAKDFMARMFGWMMPAHSGQLPLSKMNMWGIGRRMMRRRMEQKGIDSLEAMIRQAVDNGIEMIACTRSMDVMGITKDELLDGVKLGGVATYLDRAAGADLNLFV